MGTSSPLETIHTLGKYTLLEKIGEGYLGSVYRGFDQNLGQAVAVRILGDGIKWDAGIEEIYGCQCRSLAGLRHTGIASVLDFGQEGQFHYIVMESLGNSTLKSLIAQKPVMTVEAKISIMIQVAESLGHAHKNGILHRDLGPAKIHLTADGKPIIRDFAIASVLMKHIPHPWIRFGAPIYISPEQIQQKNCDQRSDIFSAGTIFYELLTYHHPFHDPDSNKALDNILQETQIPTFDLFPDEPPGIWPILKTCLAKDPNDRYLSMDELVSACRDLLKDLGEDSRLMLSELYAALTPLRKAAAKPDALDSAITLHQDIQKLLRGEKEADYVSLDRLMTILIEQLPAVQAVSGSLPAVDPAFPEFPPEETNSGFAEKSGLSSADLSAEIQNPSPIELALTTVLASGSPELSTAPPDNPQALPSEKAEPEVAKAQPETVLSEIWDPSSEMQFAFETSFVKSEEDSLFDPEFYKDEVPPDAALHASPVCELSVNVAAMPQAPLENKSAIEDRVERPEVHCAGVAVSSGEQQTLPEILPAKRKVEETPDDKISHEIAALGIQIQTDPSIDTQLAGVRESGIATCYRRITRPSYRTTVVLLSLLLIAAAAYIAWGTDFAHSMSNLVKARVLDSGIVANAFARLQNRNAPNVAAAANWEKPKAAPVPQTTLPAAKGLQQTSSGEQEESYVKQPPQEVVSRISGLIGSGKLQLAKAELDKLQRIYPSAPRVSQLRRQYEAKNSIVAQERIQKEEERLKATRQQKEDEWNRRLAALLASGQYGEADSTLNLWLAENPGSLNAKDIGTKIGEIQRNLTVYASALSEKKYQEALNALSAAERLNPADSNFAELRRQIENRKATAKASLTIHRLGAKAILSLDGRPIGSNGEIENEAIPVGNHTLAVENGGSVVMSRHQEFVENQRIVLVYDLAKQNLRTMVDADQELLVQRKAMEEIRYFDAEHEHGAFRGSCRGLLMIDYQDVAFRPSAGFHGFRIPFKLLRLSIKGRSIDLINISDNKHYEGFKLHDEQTVDKFKRSWDELKALARQ
jgi:serine/threonine protein kinase/tetratricopeptide (TPR) repeat protein